MWLPIDQCPMDNKDRLLWIGAYGYAVVGHRSHAKDGLWYCELTTTGEYCEPTHFQEIPEPPHE